MSSAVASVPRRTIITSMWMAWRPKIPKPVSNTITPLGWCMTLIPATNSGYTRSSSGPVATLSEPPVTTAKWPCFIRVSSASAKFSRPSLPSVTTLPWAVPTTPSVTPFEPYDSSTHTSFYELEGLNTTIATEVPEVAVAAADSVEIGPPYLFVLLLSLLWG